jgi:hypothetical protein
MPPAESPSDVIKEVKKKEVRLSSDPETAWMVIFFPF